MKKLTVIGTVSERENLMEELMGLGVVQISAQDAKLTDEEWGKLVSLDENEEAVTRFEQKMNRVAQALEALEKYGTAKKSLLFGRKPVRIREFTRVLENSSEIQEQVGALIELMRQIGTLKNAENKTESQRLSLLPWQKYDIPLELTQTKETILSLGVLPQAVDTERLEETIQKQGISCVVEELGEDAEQRYLFILHLKTEEEKMQDVFREVGFNQADFSHLQGTVNENISKCGTKSSELEEERKQLEEQVRGYERFKTDIQFLYDDLGMKKERALIRSKLLVTGSTFYFEGWLPKFASERVEMLMRLKNCYYEIEEPDSEEETPVLLNNNGFVSPFESITKLYALPDSRGIDATVFFSFFYAMFFGMMLSDAAYGIIMMVGTFVLMRKFRLEGMAKQLVKMFFYCGIATTFWGVMFGGYFGDLITVVAKTFFHADFMIAPLWFNPLEDPMKLLMFSFALGTVHLFLGMGLSAYMSIRDGKPLDALFDIGFWYLLLVGLVMWLAGSMGGLLSITATSIGKWMTIGGAAGILLTGGRDKKGLGRLTGGLGSLYNITSYLSDVLSYSRLLALGLATSVISSVINTLGTLAGDGIVGLVVLIIAFVIGHTYNLAINALGSFVHSCRLQYVEFFGKFYKSGGEAFDPFREKTKYVEIIKEDM